MEANNIHIADYYFELLKHLNADSKLELIERLSNSLRTKSEEKNDTSLDSLFGAFISEKSAEEIIDEIRASRTFTREIEDL